MILKMNIRLEAKSVGCDEKKSISNNSNNKCMFKCSKEETRMDNEHRSS